MKEKAPAKPIAPKHDLFASGVLKRVEKPPRPVTEVTEADFEDSEPITRLNDSDLLDAEDENNDSAIHERPSYVVGEISAASPDHPERNEDSMYSDAKRGVFGLADGMGGVPAGDRASQAAIGQIKAEAISDALADAEDAEELTRATRIAKVFNSSADTELSQTEVEAAMQDMVDRMHIAVEKIQSAESIEKDPVLFDKLKASFKEQVGKDYDPSNTLLKRVMDRLLMSIGTTATISKFWKNEEGKRFVTIAQTGDSRMYRLRDGKLERLTQDQSPLQALIKHGIVKSEDDLDEVIHLDQIKPLAEQDKQIAFLVGTMEAKKQTERTVKSVRSMMTNVIGARKNAKDVLGIDIQPDIRTHEVEKGDVYLKFSDGIHDNLTDEEIGKIAKQYTDTQAQVIAIEDAARKRMITKDNPDRAKEDDTTALSIAA